MTPVPNQARASTECASKSNSEQSRISQRARCSAACWPRQPCILTLQGQPSSLFRSELAHLDSDRRNGAGVPHSVDVTAFPAGWHYLQLDRRSLFAWCPSPVGRLLQDLHPQEVGRQGFGHATGPGKTTRRFGNLDLHVRMDKLWFRKLGLNDSGSVFGH